MQKTNLSNTNGHPGRRVNFDVEETVDKHTEDMQDVITKVPSWILRWGITVFFGILLMVVAISVFVRYPDTIKGNIKLASSNGGAVPVIVTTAGRITKLLIRQNASVKRGQPLASIETLNSPVINYNLIAPQDGKAGFAGIIEQGAVLLPNRDVFIIHAENEQFFGIMEISAGNINKIKAGQKVLINLRNYPSEEYGQLTGKITYIADEPAKGGLFEVKITLNNTGLKQPIKLKNWMTGDAQIITQDVSIMRRVSMNLFKFSKN